MSDKFTGFQNSMYEMDENIFFGNSERTYFEHIYNANMTSKVTKPRLSAIVASIGPSTNSVEVLEKLIAAGMNIARINFSHGDYKEIQETISNIRLALDNHNALHNKNHSLGLAMETKGPEIRTGELDGGLSEVEIRLNSKVQITTDPAFYKRGTSNTIYVDYEHITKNVDIDTYILLDSGAIKLKCINITAHVIICLVERGGKLGNRKNVFISRANLELPSVTDRDLLDIDFAIKNEFDIIFAAFVSDGTTIKQLRRILKAKGSRMIVLAKVQSIVAIENIDEIIDASDGILISRSDLVVEIPIEKICIVQKSIVAKCILRGKPALCSGQLLHSMIIHQKPSKAEVMDVANAIMDGVDGLILTDVTSIGENAIASISLLSDICVESEALIWYGQLLKDIKAVNQPPTDARRAISLSAVEASVKIAASAILLITTHEKSAQIMSIYRPQCPIIAVTRHIEIARQMNIHRGIMPCHFSETEVDTNWKIELNKRIMFGIEYGKNIDILPENKPVIVVFGSARNSKYENSMRIVYINHKLKQVIF